MNYRMWRADKTSDFPIFRKEELPEGTRKTIFCMEERPNLPWKAERREKETVRRAMLTGFSICAYFSIGKKIMQSIITIDCIIKRPELMGFESSVTNFLPLPGPVWETVSQGARLARSRWNPWGQPSSDGWQTATRTKTPGIWHSPFPLADGHSSCGGEQRTTS